MHLQKKAFWERGWHMVTEYTLHKLYAKSLFRTDSKSALNTALSVHVERLAKDVDFEPHQHVRRNAMTT